MLYLNFKQVFGFFMLLSFMLDVKMRKYCGGFLTIPPLYSQTKSYYYKVVQSRFLHHNNRFRVRINYSKLYREKFK